MKIEITARSKDQLNKDELAIAQLIVKNMKGEDGDHYADTIAYIVSGHGGCEILKFESEIDKNPRVWNILGEYSGFIDIRIHVYAYHRVYGFYDVQCYISDLWDFDGHNKWEIRRMMDVNHYKPCSNYSD